MPNVFVSGMVNGLSFLTTIPFLTYINENVKRRYSSMLSVGLTAFFIFLQYLVNPQGCISCLKGPKYVLMLVLFFISRFFVNLYANLYLNMLNEAFPSQVRAIGVGMAGIIGWFSVILVPYLPRMLALASIPYNIFFTFLGLLGVLSGFMLR